MLSNLHFSKGDGIINNFELLNLYDFISVIKIQIGAVHVIRLLCLFN